MSEEELRKYINAKRKPISCCADLTKYFIGRHEILPVYLTPNFEQEFNSRMCALEELKKENKDLKEKNEFLMKRDNKLHSIIDEFLKQQIHDKDLYLSQRLIRNLKQENKELKKQQKEFIELLEKEIVDSKTGSSQQYYAKEHLSKYKEIIGSDKE